MATTTDKYNLKAKLTKTHLELTLSGGGSQKASQCKDQGLILTGKNESPKLKKLFGENPTCTSGNPPNETDWICKIIKKGAGKRAKSKLIIKAPSNYDFDGKTILKIAVKDQPKSVSGYSYTLPDNSPPKELAPLQRTTNQPKIELSSDRKTVAQKGSFIKLFWKITGNDNISKAILNGPGIKKDYPLTKGAGNANKSWNNENEGLKVIINKESSFVLSVTTKDTGEIIKSPPVTVSIEHFYLTIEPSDYLPYASNVGVFYGGTDITGKIKVYKSTNDIKEGQDLTKGASVKGSFNYGCLAITSQQFEAIGSSAEPINKTAEITDWDSLPNLILGANDAILDAASLYNKTGNVIGLIAQKKENTSLFIYQHTTGQKPKLTLKPVENTSPTSWTSILPIPSKELKGFTAFGFNKNSSAFQLFAFDINKQAINGESTSHTPDDALKVMEGEKLNIIIQKDGYLIWVKDKWSIKASLSTDKKWKINNNQSEALKTNLSSWNGDISNHSIHDSIKNETINKSILISNTQKRQFTLNYIRAIPFGDSAFYNIGSHLPNTLPTKPMEIKNSTLDFLNSQPLPIGPILLMSGCGSQIKTTCYDERPQELFLNTLDKNPKWQYTGLTYPLFTDNIKQKVSAPHSFDYWKMIPLSFHDSNKYELYFYALQKKSSSDSFNFTFIQHANGPAIIDQKFDAQQKLWQPEQGLGGKSNYKITPALNANNIQLKIEVLGQVNPVSEMQNGFAFYVPNDDLIWATDLEQTITADPAWKVEVNNSPLDPYSLQKEILVYYVGDITDQTVNDLMPLTITLPTEKKVNLMDIDCVVPDYYVEKLPLSIGENSSFYLKIHDDNSEKVNKVGAPAILNWKVPKDFLNAHLTGIFNDGQSTRSLNKSAKDIGEKYFNDDANKLSVNVIGNQPYSLSAWDSDGNFYSKTINLDVKEDGQLYAMSTNTLMPAPGNGLFFFKAYGQKKVSFYRTAGGQTMKNTTTDIQSRNGYLKGCVQLPLLNSGKQETYQLWADGQARGTAVSVTVPSTKLHYVNIKASGKNDGSSWMDAFTDLQNAIDKAKEGDAILVAGGTYKPTTDPKQFIKKFYPGDKSDNRDKTFYINKNIKLYGGWAGTASLPNKRDITAFPTILSGKTGVMDDNIDGSYHVVFIDGTSSAGKISNECIIDGFTITDSRSDGGGSDGDWRDWDDHGGGILNYAEKVGTTCSPTINNCIFKNNWSEERGSAISNYAVGGESSPTISFCTFYKNTHKYYGGAIANITSAKYDTVNKDSICNPTIYNCTFFRDDPTANDSLIYFGDGCLAIVKNCIFWADGPIFSKGKVLPFQGYISYSIIKGYDGKGKVGSIPIGNGCFNKNPLFISEKIYVLHLLSYSPAIGSGMMGKNIGAYSVPKKIIYVKQNGAGKGTAWNDAANLQSAIENLSVEGNYIYVEQGFYLPTKTKDAANQRSKTFYINKNIKLFGGFADVGDGTFLRNVESNPTNLSGKIGSELNNSDRAYHIVTIDGTTSNGNITDECIIDGFIISDGSADDWFGENQGGGIYNSGDGKNSSCNPIINNCLFKNNYAFYNGGAIYNSGNKGECSPTISFCTFINNEAKTGSGAGIYSESNNPKVKKSIIKNCTLVQGKSTFSGGIHMNEESRAEITNCIVRNNSKYEITSEHKYSTISHSIIKGCSSTDYYNKNGVNLNDGGGNLDVDPLFINEKEGNLYLAINSPAIDKGKEGKTIGSLPPIRIWYVKPNGVENGSSWKDASSLQYALENSHAGDEIRVAKGIYKPTKALNYTDVRSSTFYIDKNIQIYGGFAGTERKLDERDIYKNPTILCGQIGANIDNDDGAYHVVMIDGTTLNGNITESCVFDGFIVRKGHAGAGKRDNYGGGILIFADEVGSTSNPTIKNCYFKDNYAQGGGGIGTYGSKGTCSPVISYCAFFNNIGGGSGGGIFFGGNGSPLATNCSFSHGSFQTTTGGGGAIVCSDNSQPNITKSILWNNNPNELASWSSKTPIVSHCIIKGYDGSGTYAVKGKPIKVTDCNNNDPLFIDEKNDNLHIQPYSPAIIAYGKDIILGAFPPSYRISFVNKGEVSNTNTKWDGGYIDLISAIEDSQDEQVILVAEGTYQISYGSQYEIRNKVKIYGGFKIGTNSVTRHEVYSKSKILERPILIKNDCLFDGFTIQGGAGGKNLFQIDNASPTITNCVFKGFYGGTKSQAIYIEGTHCDVSFYKCIINDNHSKSIETGYFEKEYVSFGKCGAITINVDSGRVDIISCTFRLNYGNPSSILNTGAIVNVKNSILLSSYMDYNANPSYMPKETLSKMVNSTINIQYSIITKYGEKGFYSKKNFVDKGNNISADPQFMWEPTGNFYLKPGSPALTAGENGGYIGALPEDPKV